MSAAAMGLFPLAALAAAALAAPLIPAAWEPTMFFGCRNPKPRMAAMLHGTPSSHSKNSLSKICSKGWVAQKPFVDR